VTGIDKLASGTRQKALALTLDATTAGTFALIPANAT
jgi:hypothetical protein